MMSNGRTSGGSGIRLLLLLGVILGVLTMHTSPAAAMSSSSGHSTMRMTMGAAPEVDPVQVASASEVASVQQVASPSHVDHQVPARDGSGGHHLLSPCVSSATRLGTTGPVPARAPAGRARVHLVRPSYAPAVRLHAAPRLDHPDPQDLGICRT